MAIRALPRRHRVRVAQRKPYRRVIELGVEPVVGTVALVTIRRELCGDMVGVGRGFKVRRVAGIAIRGHRLELAVGRALVAGVAFHGGVGFGQRKAIVVLLHLLDGNRPAAHSMALFTIRPQLAFVNVSMAILAALSYIRENQFHVALRAGDRLVHAAQRIAGVIVIEFRNGANRPPRIGRVAILAWSVQVAVRTMRTSRLLRHAAHTCQQQYRGQVEHAPQRPH